MPWLLIYTVVGWLIIVGMVPVVLRRQFAPGAAWAWLGIVCLHPYVGLALYMLVGETRVDPRRRQMHLEIMEKFRAKPAHAGSTAPPRATAAQIDPIYQPLTLQAEKISGLAIRPGNAFELLTDSPNMVERLIADIDAAKTQVHLLYYLFSPDQTGRKVAAALQRAAARGVTCRVLVDAVASRKFFHRAGLARQLLDAGVKVAAALPVATLKRGLPRMDLRNHRKLAIIDESIAYAGSHNLINADYGGCRAAPWVDLTGRFCGPVVAEFQGVFCEDWAIETSQMLTRNAPDLSACPDGGTPVQIVPTGPGAPGETYRRLLLAAIHCARRELILTTPYFVPDEPTLVALMMAGDRGVDVKLILPERPDHLFTAAAGRAHFAKLMDAGIAIHLYRPGLLHSKSATVDDAFVLFGSANLDVRSFNLNYELSVLMYGKEATDRTRAVQMTYLNDSRRLDPREWADRSAVRRYGDGAISLLSPLL